MSSIFEGLSQICDRWLGIDSTWPGMTEPRYEHAASFQRLCREGATDLDGQKLIKSLYSGIVSNWSGARCRSAENWRFEKQTALGRENRSPEVTLERTIAQITDENWGNQIPTASGIDDSRPHHLDLIHRRGSEFTFIELKVAANNPVSAALQLTKYGLVYAFSCNHAADLDYDMERLEILRAKQVALTVLAPRSYYPSECYRWLQEFESALNSGLAIVASEVQHVPISFRFEAFPEWFAWKPEDCQDEPARKELLWALHQRHPSFTPQAVQT